MVLRHLTLLSRPSSLDGVVWEDKHEPQLLFDLEVFLSCLCFVFIALTTYVLEYYVGAVLFLQVTVFSTLSDSIYFNHYWLDTLDRLYAVLGASYLIYASCLCWLFELTLPEVFVSKTLFKTLAIVLLSVLPISYLNNSRKNPVRSQKWRESHIRWHISGTIGAVISLMIGTGQLDQYFEQQEIVLQLLPF